MTASDCFHHSGELLLDQARFEDAVEKFEKAIELEKTMFVTYPSFLFLLTHFCFVLRSPSNILPLVNKGLALYQWKQNIGAAERCCHEALRIDDECEAAVATLARLSLQQSKIDEAVKMFERQAELARSEPELVIALTYPFVS